MTVATRVRVPAPTLGPRVAAFCAANVRQTKGRWAGKPLVFEPWQQDFLNEAFEIDPATGLRVYKEILLGLPRKNGKSTMAAGIGLYLLVADGEGGPEVYNAAGARDQARVVFQQARQFVDGSPTLGDHLLVRRTEIQCPENNGVMRVISSEAKLQHGSNPSGSVIDELWAHKTDDLYMALTTGTGAREQPLTLTITTAGFDEESPLGLMYNRALKLDDVENPTPYLTIARDRENGFLMYWFGVPLGKSYDVTDPAIVKNANPASWITESYLRKEMNKPSMRLTEYKRWHGNQWTESEEAFISPELWDACEDNADEAGNWDSPLTTALPIGVGVDMGQVYDSTAVARAQKQDDLFILRDKGWQNPYPAGHPARDAWSVNTEEVRKHIRDLKDQYPKAQAKVDRRIMPGPAVGYDPWHFSESAEDLKDDGINMVEFPQNASRMGPATELFLELVKQRRIRHDGNPVLRRHILSAVAKWTRRGWVIDKPAGSSKPIDRAVAAIIAVSMASQEAPKPRERKPTRAVGF